MSQKSSKINVEEIIEKIATCPNFSELQKLHDLYSHVPKLLHAIHARSSYLLSNLDS